MNVKVASGKVNSSEGWSRGIQKAALGLTIAAF
jgi:hypothetical protein